MRDTYTCKLRSLIVCSTGNTTVTKTGDCRVTVTFDGDAGKSVSVIVNQATSGSSQSAKSSGSGGGGGGGVGGGGPPGGGRGPPGPPGPGITCYDCDQVKRDCRELHALKAESVKKILFRKLPTFFYLFVSRALRGSFAGAPTIIISIAHCRSFCKCYLTTEMSRWQDWRLEPELH